MASLTGENRTTVFIMAPELSSVSIAHGFEQDATKKGEDQKVLESQTTVMLGAAPLSMTHGLKQDVVMTKEDMEVVEKLKKEMGSLTDEEIMEKLNKDLELATKELDEAVLMGLKEELELKYLKVYELRLLNLEMVFESQKLMFTRAMEKAWFINSVIKERCLNMCHSGEGDHLTHHKVIEKVVEFNKKIKFANFLGLNHWLYGPSNKRKRPSYQTYDQALEEAMEEYNENLRNCNETAPQMVNPPEDIEEFGNYSKKTYRRASPFTKLESREEYLESVINSLQERETERPIKETEIEILGFMLLKEIADCTLKISSSDLLNCITLSSGSCSGDGAEQDRNIHVQLDEQLYTEYANLLFDFDTSFTYRYNAFMNETKSDCSNSNNEKEKIREKLSLVEECIRKASECLVINKHHQNAWSVWRQYESELFKYCEHLSYHMRLGRCLNPLSETEKDRLKQIRDLARAVIGNYTKANGADSLPTITHPLLPSWCNY